MAEQEVAKHTRKIYKIWNSKENSFWHKTKEFLLEIVIIVFAVSLSIWVHDKSEHAHQQKDVKEFLSGLRDDLLGDINEMNEDKKSYVSQGLAFQYLTNARRKKNMNNDSLNKYVTFIFNTTRLQQNNGRFEGFKASGKIGNIEDKIIQNNIMDLYQENIPSLLASTDAYIHWKYELLDYGVKNQKRVTDSTTNISSMLMTDEAQNLCGFLTHPSEIIERYDICINKMKTILGEIESKYGISGKNEK